MKKPIFTTLSVALITASLGLFTVQAAEVSPSLKKNADILQTIMQTAFRDNEAGKLSSLQYSYLAGQGLLFQANASGGSINRVFSFRSSGNTAMVAPVAPVPPMPPMPDGDFSFEFDSDDMHVWAEAAQEMAEQQREQHEQLRELYEQQRDLEREMRDIEREKRDIEFSKKMGKLDKEQQQQLTQLEQQAKALAEQISTGQKSTEAARKELEQQREKQAEAMKQQTAAMIKSVGEKFSQVLCDYGAGLRELADNEYVSLQLNTRGSDGRYYWVVKKADINQCLSGKIKAKELLAKANSYQF